MKKKLFFALCLGVCLGAILALGGLRLAPKISFKKGLELQKKVCPMFAVQANNYCALETKRDALRRANTKIGERLERLKKDSIDLRVAEKFLKPKSKSKNSSEAKKYQLYLIHKESSKKEKVQTAANNQKKDKILAKL